MSPRKHRKGCPLPECGMEADLHPGELGGDEDSGDSDPAEDHAGLDAEALGPGKRRLTLKDMVRGAATTPRAVRFYEEQQLIRTAGRSPGGHRLFDAAELPKLRMILELRTCGFSIEEIRDILSAKAQHGTVREAAQAIQRMLNQHVQELRRKIDTIERLGREFTSSIQLLDRCVHCADPRGAAACHGCDLPLSSAAPESFRHIWAVAGAAPKPLPPPSDATDDAHLVP